MPRALEKPCPTCGRPGQMVQLDCGHWIGACVDDCTSADIHWSKVAARQMWNAIPRPVAAEASRV